MKKGKSSTVFVLALEIAAIAVLHAIKLNHNEKATTVKEISSNNAPVQPELKTRSVYSLAAFK